MAITYLSGERIQGSTASDDWIDAHANIGVNTSTGKLDATIVDGTNSASVHDLGAGNVSDTAWVLRFEFTEVTNLGDFGWIGISSGDQSVSATSTSQDFVGMEFGEDGNIKIQGTNGAAIDGGGGVSTSFEQTTGTKYYIEIKRTAADSANITVRTTSHTATGGDVRGTATNGSGNQMVSGISGLRYLKLTNRTQGGASSGTLTIENLYFWNGVTTAGSNASADYSSAVWLDDKTTLVTTFADTLGSAANATNSGAVVDNATAIYGKKSLIFTSDTVNLGNDLDAITSAFTFTCWAYFESASAGDKTIISKTYTSSWSSPLYHSFTVHQATTNVQLVVNNGSTYYSLSVALGGAGWHFITVTKTSGHVWVLQVDNNTSGTYTHSPNWGTQDWVVGNTPVIMDRPWDGKIQDMAFWSRVLTSAELTTLYGTKSGTGNATSSATGVVATDISTTGLKAYYTFNDATTGVTNGAIDYSNLPAGTRYEETDTRKIFRLKDGGWVEKGTA